MTHALKTIQPFFSDVEKGFKNFEIRRDDRPFKVDDTVLLQEYNSDHYTGNEVEFTISYILRDAEKFGLKKGFCILGLKPKENY